ncbi:MAG: type II CAAX prenyl endopeptidase Rce1 family protein [Candidatus Hodarchaeota archaeon]
MNKSLPIQFCPNCMRKTPTKNFCIFCGENLVNTKKCTYCQASAPISANFCPYCGQSIPSVSNEVTIKEKTQIDHYLVKFRVSILIIFLLSTFSLAQILIGSFMILIFPNELAPSSSEIDLINLFSMILSSIFMIFFLTKWMPFSFQKDPPVKNNVATLIYLLVILIVSVSIIEIIIILVDFGLDIFHLSPSRSSPYDSYFMNPINSIIFLLLVVFVGPILEELIFRRFVISLLSSQTSSKFVVLTISALMFGLTHTPADLIDGSLRYAILHLIATFLLGFILGIIFLAFNMKYAIVFHSFWNIFSFITQLLIIDGYVELVDSILVFFIAITAVLACFALFHYKTTLQHGIKGMRRPPKREFLIICLNFTIIIVYEVFLPLVLFSFSLNIITAGAIFLSQVVGFLLGLVLINREKRVFGFINLGS